MSSNKQLIVGLGNPGKDYRYTRHNLGFLVVEKLAEVLDLKLSLSSFTNGITAEGSWNDHDIVLLMPLTYMNKSGNAIRQAINVKEIKLEDMLVVCDDINLPFRQIRIRSKGSDGGHNGLSSIIECCGDTQFNRLRMGIDLPKGADSVDYVLEEFKRAEKNQLDEYVDDAVRCVQAWLNEGIERAMEQFNQKR